MFERGTNNQRKEEAKLPVQLCGTHVDLPAPSFKRRYEKSSTKNQLLTEFLFFIYIFC